MRHEEHSLFMGNPNYNPSTTKKFLYLAQVALVFTWLLNIGYNFLFNFGFHKSFESWYIIAFGIFHRRKLQILNDF